MKKFRIVVEVSQAVMFSQEFEAESMEDAQRLAEETEWDENSGWTEIDVNTSAEIRDDQCEEVTDGQPDQNNDGASGDCSPR